MNIWGIQGYNSWLQMVGVHGGLFIVVLPVPTVPGDPVVVVGSRRHNGRAGDPCAARGSAASREW